MRKVLILAGLLAGWTTSGRGADTPVASPAPASPVAPTPGSAVAPAVRALLDRSAAYYAAHRSFEADLKSVTKMDASGMKQEFDSSFHLAAQRPNLLALTLQGGMLGGTAVCDGKKLVSVMPMARRYTSIDAPAQFSDLFAPMRLALAVGGLPLGFESFFNGHADTSVGAALTASQDLGLETIGGLPAHHLRLTGKVGTTDLWIADGEQPLLLQAGSQPDMSGALGHLSAAQKAKLPPGWGSMKMERLTTYTNWKIDQPIAPAVFTYQPPSGYTLLEVGGNEEKPSPLVGQKAGDFALPDLGGKNVTLKSLRGQVVVLDFWATWCGPCAEALPLVSSTLASFQGKGAVFYAVNQQESADAVRKFQADKSLSFPVLLDADGKVGALYQAGAIPETVLIDQTGTIRAVHVGYDPEIKKLLTKQLTDLLAGKPLETAPVSPKP